MFVLAEARSEEVDLFFNGYGETDIDTLALAYYRYNWCVEDIGSFAVQVFGNSDAGLETKRDSVRWFKYLFAPGSSVPAALDTEVTVNRK